MKKILFISMLIVLVPAISYAQNTPKQEEIVNAGNIIDPEENGVITGFEGDPPMPSQEEINKVREESGYNDFVEGSDVQNEEPECFDYYTFQSVQVSFSTEKDIFKPGEIVKISGRVSNENSYPVVDGNVFVRVSQRNGNYKKEGNFVIDEFFAAEGLVIDKNGEKEVAFEWLVPESASPTEYVFDYFFSVGKKFNLGGLPFSNEVIMSNMTFTVVSDQTSFISLDRTGTKVNNVAYKHIGNWPIFDAGEKVTVMQSIINTFDTNKDVEIKYDLYYWDSLNADDLINSKEESVTIPAGDNVVLQYVIPEMKDTVYYLKITARAGDQQSIVNIRMASNQEHARLNYPAITKFPVNSGEKFTLFTCFHNSSSALTNGRLEVKIFDKSNNEIGTAMYEGDISPAMMVAKEDLIAQGTYEYIRLQAELYDDENSLIEKYEAVYDCHDLNNCRQGAGKEGIFSASSVLLILFLFIPVIVVLYLIVSRRKNNNNL